MVFRPTLLSRVGLKTIQIIQFIENSQKLAEQKLKEKRTKVLLALHPQLDRK